MKTMIVFLLLFLVIPLAAQTEPPELMPDKPQPQHVANKEFWIEVALLGASWTADTISTQHAFNRFKDSHETGFFFTGSRSTAKIVSAAAAFDVGTIILSYEWKKHVHNRYLHPLWRVPLLLDIETHTVGGALHNYTLHPQ